MISEIYNEDCMEGMSRYPDNYFDLAIVDTPYGIGDFSQHKSRHLTYNQKVDWNDAIPNKEYFLELERVSKNRIIWGVNYYTEYIRDRGRIIHDKTGGGKRNQLKELSDVDLASHSFGVNLKIFRYVWQGNVQGNRINWNNDGKNGRIHPCQKPLELYEWCLMNYAKEGDKILDTHLGSGSSRIAAHNLGFDFVGFELNKEYFEASDNRFKEVTSQQVLFK